MATFAPNNASNTLISGTQNDDTVTFTGVGTSDTVDGSDGNDTITVTQGAANNYTSSDINAGLGNDVISGFGNFSLIYGNQGNDSIVDNLSTGVDTITGGMGNDTILFGNVGAAGASISSGIIYGNEGNNQISITGGGNDTIYGGNSSVDAAGNGDGNNIIDISAQNSVTGGPSVVNDLIFGGSGNDIINFGQASVNGTATGDGGSNTFRFQSDSIAAASASVVGASSGMDVVTDFISGVDKFSLTSVNGTGSDFSTQNVVNYGTTVSGGTSLQAAAASAISGASTSGAMAATFQYGADFYMVADIDGVKGFDSNDVLVDIKNTSSLTKNDFI